MRLLCCHRESFAEKSPGGKRVGSSLSKYQQIFLKDDSFQKQVYSNASSCAKLYLGHGCVKAISGNEDKAKFVGELLLYKLSSLLLFNKLVSAHYLYCMFRIMYEQMLNSMYTFV